MQHDVVTMTGVRLGVRPIEGSNGVEPVYGSLYAVHLAVVNGSAPTTIALPLSTGDEGRLFLGRLLAVRQVGRSGYELLGPNAETVAPRNDLLIVHGDEFAMPFGVAQ